MKRVASVLIYFQRILKTIVFLFLRLIWVADWVRQKPQAENQKQEI